MRTPITFFFLCFILTDSISLTASAHQPPQAIQNPRMCGRAECAAGLCMAAIGASLVFGMLIAGSVDQSSSSSYNVTTEGVAPHSFVAHASGFDFKGKSKLHALRYTFKQKKSHPTASTQQLKNKFTQHNFQHVKQRMPSKNNKQKK